MGYLIKPNGGGDLVKIETYIKSSDMQQLATLDLNNGYQLTTSKPDYIFCPVSAMLQVNGKFAFSSFSHIWLWQGGGSPKIATYGRTSLNTLEPGVVANFIVDIDHGTTATNQFGVKTTGTRDLYLKMNTDDSSGDGDGLLTIYGYYIKDFL